MGKVGGKLTENVRVSLHVHWYYTPSFENRHVSFNHTPTEIKSAKNKSRGTQRHVGRGALCAVGSMAAEADIDRKGITTHEVCEIQPPV